MHLPTKNHEELAWPIAFKKHRLSLLEFPVADCFITEIELFSVILGSHPLEVTALLKEFLDDKEMFDCPLLAWNSE
jgi:hypothetical protein